MYMNQSMESFENWRDSQYDRPEPDTDTPDEQIVRSYTFDYPNDTVLTYTRTGNSSELMLSFSSEDPDAGVEELMYAGDQGESDTDAFCRPCSPARVPGYGISRSPVG